MDVQVRKGMSGMALLPNKPSRNGVTSVTERLPMIQVLLAMKNRLLRESLARVLNRRGDLQVVGPKGPEEISEGDMAKSDCDVLLLDFVDPEWLLRTKVRNPCGAKTIRIVAIGMEAEPEQFLKAVRVGVIGYLLKDASAFDVVAAVRAAVLGKASCAPQLCTLLFHEVAKIPESCQSKQPRKGARLTLRQGNLMRLVANGMTNKEIAMELGLSEFTVKNHMSRILKQLDAEDRSEAVEKVRSPGYQVSV